MADNAYLAAQAEGKSPALCANGSAFLTLADTCNDCIATFSTTTANTTNQTYPDPDLSQFIDYCSVHAAASAVSTISSSNGGQQGSGTVTTTPSPTSITTLSTETLYFTTDVNGTPTVVGITQTTTLADTAAQSATPISTVTLHISTEILGEPTVLDFTKPIFPPAPSTKLILVTTTIDNVVHTWTFTETYSQLPSGSQNSLLATSTLEASPSPTQTPLPSPNKAWIAGPVVGVIVGVVLIGLLAWWIRVRRQRRENFGENPQELEGDATVNPELHENFVPAELIKIGHWSTPAEVTGDNPPAVHDPQELPGNYEYPAAVYSPQELSMDGQGETEQDDNHHPHREVT
jgi:hypothetical protein